MKTEFHFALSCWKFHMDKTKTTDGDPYPVETVWGLAENSNCFQLEKYVSPPMGTYLHCWHFLSSHTVPILLTYLFKPLPQLSKIHPHPDTISVYCFRVSIQDPNV